MSASSPSIGELSYGSLYLPAATFGYLASQSDSIVYDWLPVVELYLIVLSPEAVLYLLAAVSFLGALQVHGISRAIFGPDGPGKRPKHENVFPKHLVAIILGEPADELPVLPYRLQPKGVVGLINHLAHPDGANRLDRADSQFRELWELVTWKKVPRILYFIPALLERIVTWLSFVAVGATVLFGSNGYVALLLLFAHIVLLFRGLLWAPIPSYTNHQAVADLMLAEYEIAEEELREN